MSTTRRPAAGIDMMKQVFPTVVAADAKGDENSLLISTGGKDRQGDILVPEGCDYANFLKNPSSPLYGHDNSELPVGKTTGISIEPTGVRATFRWLENDERANRVRNAWNQGYACARRVWAFVRSNTRTSRAVTNSPSGNSSNGR